MTAAGGRVTTCCCVTVVIPFRRLLRRIRGCCHLERVSEQGVDCILLVYVAWVSLPQLAHLTGMPTGRHLRCGLCEYLLLLPFLYPMHLMHRMHLVYVVPRTHLPHQLQLLRHRRFPTHPLYSETLYRLQALAAQLQTKVTKGFDAIQTFPSGCGAIGGKPRDVVAVSSTLDVVWGLCWADDHNVRFAPSTPIIRFRLCVRIILSFPLPFTRSLAHPIDCVHPVIIVCAIVSIDVFILTATALR